MDKLLYTKIGDVNGRWLAEIIKSYLEAEGIEVMLFEESITQAAYVTAFGLVQIFVPKFEVSRARTLLKSYEEFQPTEEDE